MGMLRITIRGLFIFSLNLSSCVGVRVVQQHMGNRTRTTSNSGAVRMPGSRGEVDGLVTVGAPAGSDPGMPYPRTSDGCFPGLRIVAARELIWGQQQVDIVPPLTTPLGFAHPHMRAAKIFIGSDRIDFASCGEEFDSPAIEIPSGQLHNEEEVYFPETPKYDLGSLANLAAKVSLPQSTSSNPEEVNQAIRPYGWHLVASAFDGNSMSHLMQNPSSLECFLTFRGSKSFQDWTGNLQIRKVDFCGLPQKVHNGFRNNLKGIVASADWQQKIRPALPACSKVYAVGHSLGGITAQFLAACAAQAPVSGQKGYEDYALIGWTRGVARVLTYPWG